MIGSTSFCLSSLCINAAIKSISQTFGKLFFGRNFTVCADSSSYKATKSAKAQTHHASQQHRWHSPLLSSPSFWLLRHCECKHLRFQHLLLHQPPLLLAAHGGHLDALHLCLSLSGFLGQQLRLLFCNLSLFRQQVRRLLWAQLEGSGRRTEKGQENFQMTTREEDD